jgi:hypothetical protein
MGVLLDDEEEIVRREREREREREMGPGCVAR